MSGSGRKRSSKWDLKDEHEFASDSKQMRSGWHSADVAGSDGSKWSYLERNDKVKPNMGFPSKETFSGGRGLSKENITNKDYNRVLDSSVAWQADGDYSTEMSPGFEDWKYKRQSQSPKDGWGRSVRSRSRSRSMSRSRSPARIRWDSGFEDRNRTRPGGETQLCRDFAGGKCRRGNRCHFLHDDQSYEDNWDSRHRKDGAPRYSAPHESRDYSLRIGRSNDTCISFINGRCRMGASCKYVHHGNADESAREREIDRRRREGSFERGGGHEPNRSLDTPCKFFAARNCRNGKYCRFSHDRQVRRSPSRRVREERWGSNPGGDQVLDRPKWSDSVSPNGQLRDESDRWGSDRNMIDSDKAWDSPKWNDTVVVSDATNLRETKIGNMSAPEKSGFTSWPTSEGWDHGLDKNKLHVETTIETDKKEGNQWKAEIASTDTSVPQSIGTDKMSPDWSYCMGSSSHINEEHGQNKLALSQDGPLLATSERDRIPAAPAPGQGFHQSSQSINALHPSSCHVVGQSQVAVPIIPPRGGNVDGPQNQDVSAENNYSAQPNMMDASSLQVGSRNPSTQNLVSNEQLTQLTNLSASLAHFLGTGQPLPQLYTALNSHDAKDSPSLAKTEESREPVSATFNKPDPVVGFQKQYDPMSDSIEPKKVNASGIPLSLTPSKKSAEGEIETLPLLSNSGTQHSSEASKTAASKKQQIVNNEQLIQLQPGENIEITKANNERMVEEKQKSREHCGNTKENDPLENTDQNGGPDESKKTKEKDVKGVRAFKFALVEFVKELLKPTWKDGQISKEHYKTIVKKVVDKVTGTMQGAHIPQTQEKIDHYLSFSKPKLTKLVQAYVEKVQKA